MPKSARVRMVDHRAIWELVNECRDLGDDARLWRLHFAGGLSRLIDADVAVTGEFESFTRCRRDVGNAAWGLGNGLSMAGWEVAQRLMRTDPDYAIGFRRYADRRVTEDGVALTYADMINREEWERSDEYQLVFRAIGIDVSLICFRVIAGTADDTHGLVFSRTAGRRDFTRRQAAIAREGVAVVTGMLGGPLARFDEPSPAALAPRVRQVLACLLDGDSDKQVAARLRLSPYTVNQYVKSIFLHFGVSTRTELLARWVKRGWGRGGWA